MQLTNQEAERVVREGVAALREGRPSKARAAFESITRTGRANAQIWLLLASACRAEGDAGAEESALDQLLVIEPRLLRAHVMKGDCRARAGDEPGMMRFYKSALLIADGQRLPDDLAAEIRRVEAATRQVSERLAGERDAALTTRGLPPERRSPRFRQSLDIMSGQKRLFVQEPTSYYFPELPQRQYYDPAAFDWAHEIEAATASILAEVQNLLAGGFQGARPYIKSEINRPRIDNNPLLDSADWSALFLCENGCLNEEAVASCPKTWEAVQAAPLPRIANSPTVMFSMLRAGARILPHTGMVNTRLTCHLPLIVPSGCGFRVGNEVREWEQGKLLIFDDTIEHEAWNNSSTDRMVLIFDIWRPELDERERQEVAALFAGSGLA